MSIRTTNPWTPNRSATLGLATLLLVAHATQVARSRPADPPRAAPADITLRLDPNRATARELELLPRIGPKLAANIVAFRAASSRTPAFARPEDLLAVPRIGPTTVEQMRPYLLFAAAQSDATAPQSP